MNRRPTSSPIGDAGRFLRALAARGGHRARRDDWIDELRARDAAREREIAVQARAQART